MDIRLPSGKVISNIPDGTSKEVIRQKLISSGVASEADFGPSNAQNIPVEAPIARRSTSRGARSAPPVSEPIYRDLPEETVQQIQSQIPIESGRGIGSRVAGRRRLANLERIRQDNPYLAELIENTSGLEATAIGAGKQVEDIGQGLGRLFGILDAEDARDAPEYKALQGVKSQADLGEFLAEGAMFALPGGAATRISSTVPRVLATGAVEGAASGLNTAGEGGTTGEIATSTALGAGIGGVAGKFIKPKIKSTESRADSAVELFSEGATVRESTKKADIRQAIQTGDKLAAKYKLNQRGKVVEDSVAKRALTQGFDDKAIATVKHSSREDKRAMLKILDQAERSMKSGVAAARNRPSDVIGESVMRRWNAVKNTNKIAGQNIEKSLQKIKNKNLEVSDVVDSFTDDLENLGVIIDDKLQFKGSQIEGNRAIAPIKRVYERLKTTDTVENLHNLKRYVDRQIDWDKNPAEPLDREAVNALKKLRNGINEKIRGLSDDYAKANDVYSETVQSLGDIMDVMGRRFDPNSEGANALIGQEMRKVLSNYAKRVDMIQAVDKLDSVATKYGSKFADDPVHQVVFYNDLERVFGSFAPNSLQGVTEKAGERIVKGALRGNIKEGVISTVVDSGFNKLRGVSDTNAIKAMRTLLTSK